MAGVLPRVVIAGLAGDTGKSLVSIGLIGACRRQGLKVAPFKKGPDFIDAGWLGAAAGTPGRNLDTFLMPTPAILASLARASEWADIAVLEGNRGLFDGLDSAGQHSTAMLSQLIGAPVVLVIDATKVTRTVAAYVLGCQALGPGLNLAGVVLNRVGTTRQEAVIRQALAQTAGVPVLGAIPNLERQYLPHRHLGLVTPTEHPDTVTAIASVTEAILKHLDVPAIIRLAGTATTLEPVAVPLQDSSPRVKIGVLRDEAFSFYYPENLEALEAAGAELVPISPLRDTGLPGIAGLYAGGGFPEVHAGRLAANEPFRAALARQICEGLPVWAECGGLMYLSRALTQDTVRHPMVGALPVMVEQAARPQGHGYVEAEIDAPNPFFPCGQKIRGHEFHYSQLESSSEAPSVMALGRGTGIGGGRDGIHVNNVVATYTHLHALGSPSWAPAFVGAARGN